MPFSTRPLVMVVWNWSLVSTFSELTNEGPTNPSCSGPWQRSQAIARQVFQPCKVLGSTWLPSLTVYSFVVADLCSHPGGGGSAARTAASVAIDIMDINTTENTGLIARFPLIEESGWPRLAYCGRPSAASFDDPFTYIVPAMRAKRSSKSAR